LMDSILIHSGNAIRQSRQTQHNIYETFKNFPVVKYTRPI
jgi:hypothetical protein